MGNTVLGVVAPLPQGAWNSTTTYQKLSVVRKGNSSYIAKSANVNIQPGVTDSWETYWMLLNEDGDTGQQGPQGETGVGVPDGGLKGDILVKRSQANYDDEWVDPDNITVGNATKALQDENGNNIADTYQTKQDSTNQNTALQTQITSNTQSITQNSQLISRNSARLTNVEQRISPSPFVTDSTVAYVKDVPANALPYAELQKLGGMTYRVNLGTDDAPNYVLRSAPVTSVDNVGANLFDIDKRLYGTIDSNDDLLIEYGSNIFYDYDFKENTQYTLSGYVKNQNTTGNVRLEIQYTDGTVYSGALLNGTTDWKYVTYTTPSGKTIETIRTTYSSQGAMYIKGGELMLNEGSTALPYAPYTKSTLPIPEAVQALDGYGEGNPDDPTEYNSIQWDKKGNCSYSHKGNIVNNEWVPLSNEIVTGISALITADNLIPVQGNGTITFVNEYGYAVPSTVEYMT